MLDVIIDSPSGAFGSGTHPTTDDVPRAAAGDGARRRASPTSAAAPACWPSPPRCSASTPVLAIDHETQRRRGDAAQRRGQRRRGRGAAGRPARDPAAAGRRPSPPTSRPPCTPTSPPHLPADVEHVIVSGVAGRPPRARRRRLCGGGPASRWPSAAAGGWAAVAAGAVAEARSRPGGGGGRRRTASSPARLPEGGLALSGHKLVEEGARALLLVRARPAADRRAPAGGHAAGDPARADRRPARTGRPRRPPSPTTARPPRRRRSRVVRFQLPLETEPLPDRRPPAALLHARRASTGRRHFVGHAILREMRPDQ